MEIVRDKNIYASAWRKAGLSFMQSWEWGEVKSPQWRPERLALQNIPCTIFVRKFPGMNRHFGYAPRALSAETANGALLREIADHAKNSLHLTHLVIEPNIETDQGAETMFKSAGYFASGKTIQPNQTNSIDLTMSENDIFMRMRESTRKKIRKAAKLGCTVEELHEKSPGAVERFYAQMKAIIDRTAYVMHGKEYFQKIWNLFGEARSARIFVAKKDGRDIGALFYLYDERGAYELYGGVAEKERGLMANYLLKWEGVRGAKRLGKRFYDQWGVAPMRNGEFNPHDPLYSISLFKDNFGGKYTEFMSQQTIVFDKAFYAAYRAGIGLQGAALHIKKLFRFR